MTNSEIIDALNECTFEQMAYINQNLGPTGRLLIVTGTDQDGYSGDVGEVKNAIESASDTDIVTINAAIGNVYVKDPC